MYTLPHPLKEVTVTGQSIQPYNSSLIPLKYFQPNNMHPMHICPCSLSTHPYILIHAYHQTYIHKIHKHILHATLTCAVCDKNKIKLRRERIEET